MAIVLTCLQESGDSKKKVGRSTVQWVGGHSGKGGLGCPNLVWYLVRGLESRFWDTRLYNYSVQPTQPLKLCSCAATFCKIQPTLIGGGSGLRESKI